jgi:hypothetical protein
LTLPLEILCRETPADAGVLLTESRLMIVASILQQAFLLALAVTVGSLPQKRDRPIGVVLPLA